MAVAIVILKGESMRGGSRSGESDNTFPTYPIGPILESYGGSPVAEGLGWKPYRCPFHSDRDASGSVNSDKQVFNCHAADCPKGNAVQVLMQYERLTYVEALERVQQITGQVDSSQPFSSRRRGGSRGAQSGGTRFRRTWR